MIFIRAALEPLSAARQEDGGLHHSKTDLGWKIGNPTVGQGVLLDVPNPRTENVAVQKEMNHTTKWLWSESVKEIVDGGRRVAGERAALITRGDD